MAVAKVVSAALISPSTRCSRICPQHPIVSVYYSSLEGFLLVVSDKCQEVNAPGEQLSASDGWELKDKFSIFLAPGAGGWRGRERRTLKYFPYYLPDAPSGTHFSCPQQRPPHNAHYFGFLFFSVFLSHSSTNAS